MILGLLIVLLPVAWLEGIMAGCALASWIEKVTRMPPSRDAAEKARAAGAIRKLRENR